MHRCLQFSLSSIFSSKVQVLQSKKTVLYLKVLCSLYHCLVHLSPLTVQDINAQNFSYWLYVLELELCHGVGRQWHDKKMKYKFFALMCTHASSRTCKFWRLLHLGGKLRHNVTFVRQTNWCSSVCFREYSWQYRHPYVICKLHMKKVFYFLVSVLTSNKQLTYVEIYYLKLYSNHINLYIRIMSWFSVIGNWRLHMLLVKMALLKVVMKIFWWMRRESLW